MNKDKEVFTSVPFTSSTTDFEKFRTGTIWADMQAYIANGIRNLRDELETMGTGTGYTPDEIPYALAFIQGQIFACRLMSELVDHIITMKKEDEDEESNSRR